MAETHKIPENLLKLVDEYTGISDFMERSFTSFNRKEPCECVGKSPMIQPMSNRFYRLYLAHKDDDSLWSQIRSFLDEWEVSANQNFSDFPRDFGFVFGYTKVRFVYQTVGNFLQDFLWAARVCSDPKWLEKTKEYYNDRPDKREFLCKRCLMMEGV